MTPSCMVFTTDTSYLFPTLVSAIQAREFSSPSLADVLVIGIGLPIESIRLFTPIFERENIRLLALDESAIDHQPAMLARLFLNKIVPPQYEQFLYLDGDVHIHRSLDPLIETYVPPGQVLAANDPIAFLLDGASPLSRRLTRYFQSVRVPEAVTANYFNSGVLRMPRDGWDKISEAALAHYLTHHRLARFPDQDALNIAAFGNRLQMSLAWNFPVFLRNAGLHTSIDPHITHFMANPKPWQGNFAPWDAETVVPYQDILQRYPSLESLIRPFSSRTHAMYKLQQFGKRWYEALAWGIGSRKRQIMEYENNLNTFVPPIPGLVFHSAE
jgi:lipopolysaccharide biosynthesis glycosyltransferase